MLQYLNGQVVLPFHSACCARRLALEIIRLISPEIVHFQGGSNNIFFQHEY